jgi:hypothetical protein
MYSLIHNFLNRMSSGTAYSSAERRAASRVAVQSTGKLEQAREDAYAEGENLVRYVS